MTPIRYEDCKRAGAGTLWPLGDLALSFYCQCPCPHLSPHYFCLPSADVMQRRFKGQVGFRYTREEPFSGVHTAEHGLNGTPMAAMVYL